MRVRHVLGIALCFGAMSALTGQTAQAQPTDPVPFVQLLLMRETSQINKEVATIAQQDKLGQLLNAGAGSTGKMQRLVKSIDKLQSLINSRVSLLRQLGVQLNAVLRAVPSPNPYTSQAAANAAIIQALAARPQYGIGPATTIK